MAVRKDTVQLNIEFITDESRALAKANVDTKALTNELRKTVKAGGDVADVMRRIEAAGAKVEDIDLSKVAPAQLITRARQLKQVLDQLPSSSPRAAKLQQEYKRLNDRLATLRQNSRGVADAFSKGKSSLIGSLTGALALIGGVVGAFRGLFSVISGGVQRAATFEQLNVSLSTFLGSAEKAQQVIEDLQKFSIATPFEPEQVNRAGKALLAFGIQQEALIPLLTKVGDVAAGTGKDFNELVLIVGKARAAGRIQGEELNQLAEAGIPIYDELAKVTGRQTTEIRKLGEQGKLSYEDLEAVFTNLTAEGGRFNGLLEKQSQTITGLASTARGALGALSRNIGNAFAPLIKTVLPPAIALINRLTERFGPLAEVVGQKMVRVFRFFAGVFRPLVESVQRLGASIGSVSDGTGRFSAIMQALGATLAFVVNAISGLITFVSRLINTFASLGGGSGGLLQRVFVQPITTAIDIFGKFVAVLNGLVSATRVALDAVGSIGEVFKGSLGLALDQIKGLFSDNEAAINARKASLVAAYSKLGGSIGEAFTQGYNDALGQANTPAFAGGGAAGAGSGGGPVTRIQDAPETKAQAKAAAKEAAEAARIAKLKAERALDTAAASIDGGDGPASSISRRSVDAALEALEAQGKAEADILQRLRNDKQISEEQFELGRLELKRTLALQEIEILREGTAEEVALANQKKEEIGAIDQSIFEKKEDLAKREAELRKNLENLKVQTATEAVDAIVAVLGRDEKARKKNAAAIKAFQKGQAIIAGLSEIANIRASTAAQAKAVGGLGPVAVAAVGVLGAIRIGAAIAQTAVTVGKINAQQFARGGRVKSGTFGGNLHSNGGTRGVFEDGTQVEVQRGEDFFILNREASAERARLSALNVAHGGVPLFNDGGSVFSAPSTTPTIAAGLLPAAGTSDNSALQGTMSALLDAFNRFPTRLKADVVYGDITQAGSDLDAARGAAEV